jgi:hypothetical protein
MNENPYAPPHSQVADVVPGRGGPSAVDILTFDQLRNADKWRFFWGYLWRGLVAAVLSGVAGAIIGAVIGALIGGVGTALGMPQAEWLLLLRVIGGIVGAAVGLVSLWQLIRWLFHSHWFGFRLRLVRDAK